MSLDHFEEIERIVNDEDLVAKLLGDMKISQSAKREILEIDLDDFGSVESDFTRFKLTPFCCICGLPKDIHKNYHVFIEAAMDNKCSNCDKWFFEHRKLHFPCDTP
jgi:hypothetical protein